MHFLTLDKLLPIETQNDLYLFWLSCLAFRKNHRHLEKELADYVFTSSNKAKEAVSFDYAMENINFEFKALETVGHSDTKTYHRNDEADKQWQALEIIVNEAFSKRS